MKDVVIVDAARTPVGSLNGTLKGYSAPQLGGYVIKELFERNNLNPSLIEEVIMGHVINAGVGQAPARQAAYKWGGIPSTVSAYTIGEVCGSGLRAVMVGADAIRSGRCEIIIAGGMESMSQSPHLVYMRQGKKMGDAKLKDSMVNDGLWCSFNDIHMGMTAEHIAKLYNISRQEQDEFAAWSYAKAVKARDSGKFNKEIIPLKCLQKKGKILMVNNDEDIRESSLEALANLKPVFDKKGTVTAGNASSCNDAAAAVLLMSKKKALREGYKPLAEIIDYTGGGIDPIMIMMAPVVAVKKLLKKNNKTVDDYDLIEANEAFSVQGVALQKKLGFKDDILNVNGGAVALGHPIGASGARVLTTLIYAMQDRGKELGLATLCLGGGNAVAMEVKLYK